jgi:type IV secretion system protein VirB2
MTIKPIRQALFLTPSTFSALVVSFCPTLALAQANVFEQGATNLITELTLFALPFAILAVMAVGILAASGRISWGWPIGVILGIALLFGAPQIVSWVRNIFVV